MLDIVKIRNNKEKIEKALLKRLDEVDLDILIELDDKRKALTTKTEEMKSKKNIVSKRIPELKKTGKDISILMNDMKDLSNKIKEVDDELKSIIDQLNTLLESLPNIPADDVVSGGKENNVVIREFGKKPKFDFNNLDHVELVTKHKLVDYERGAKLGGSGFWIYRNKGAILEWALLNYFIEEHLKDGYEFILPPHILNYQCGYTAGQFPKFKDEVFHVETDDEKDLFLLPTAETALVNIYRDEILTEEELPKKLFAYTPCFRKEAGSYRTEERGMIRGHQFNKVELFQYTLPEKSNEALEEMINKAERLLIGLGLHHRVSKLAAKDCSASMAKTYDIEVWIPSMDEYKEVSSASNGMDYQARRGKMRFKRKDGKNTEFLHTLNASGLATSRLLPAIVEQFQQKDGTIIIPEVLRKWTGFDKLEG